MAPGDPPVFAIDALVSVLSIGIAAFVGVGSRDPNQGAPHHLRRRSTSADKAARIIVDGT